MKGLLILRAKHTAGKCIERCQIGSGNGEVPAEWGWRGMEDGVHAGAAWDGVGWQCKEEEKRFPHLLQDVPVELLLAVAQELPNHLAAEAFPLEQEVCHSNGGVRYEASGDQKLDPFVWVSEREGQRHGEFACDAFEALLPPGHLIVCSNAVLSMCMGSQEFMCLAGMGLGEGREK